MNTILYITYAPVTGYLGTGLQIDTALKNGFNVKILEINSFFGFPAPKHDEKYYGLAEHIQSLGDLKKTIRTHNPSNTIINVQMIYEWRFRKIFRMMSALSEYTFTIFLLGQLPFNADVPLWKKVFSTSPAKVPFKILTRVLSKLLFKIKYFSNQNILFYAGETLANASQYPKAYPINYFDYDAYLEDPEAGDENYILFLDDALFQHPDDKLVGNIIENSTIDSYQKSLNNYFDFIETTTGLKVLVAAHPKANHSEYFFGKRTTIKNATQKLVKNATLVTSHCSSSVSFAVCYGKPIIFLTSNTIIEFSKKYQPFHQYIQNFARHLDSELINMDDPFVEIQKEQYKINQEKYETFKRDYLTTNSTRNTVTKDLIIGYFMDILTKK